MLNFHALPVNITPIADSDNVDSYNAVFQAANDTLGCGKGSSARVEAGTRLWAARRVTRPVRAKEKAHGKQSYIDRAART